LKKSFSRILPNEHPAEPPPQHIARLHTLAQLLDYCDKKVKRNREG
jgi:hypothetical protein